MTRSYAGALLALAFATTEAEAHDLLTLALHRGAPPDVLQQALAEWRELQAASVQTIYSHGGNPK